MLTPDGRKFSELNQVNDLRDDDFIPLLRPSEPLADDQNATLSGRRAKEIMGGGTGGTPAPSVPIYGGPGTHTDGPMHQLATTTALALKASIYTSINYINEVEVEDGDNINGFGLSFVLLGSHAVLYGGAGINPAYLGRIYAFRNPTTTPTLLEFGATTSATIDGAASLLVQPGEWGVLRLHAGGYNVVMRGRLDGAVLLPSPNGSLWRVTVDNTGAVGATPA